MKLKYFPSFFFILICYINSQNILEPKCDKNSISYSIVANLSEYLENEKNIDGREIYATPIQDSLKTKKVGILKEFELNRANFDNIEEYDSYEDLIKDLQNRKLDGIIVNEGLSNKTVYFTDDISRINTPLEVKSHSFAFQKGNTDYLNSFNDFMKNSDGGKEKFIRLWKSINTGEKAIEEVKKGLTGENGIINAVFRLNNEPYTYKDENGEITGIEILILYNYARENGYGVNLKGANSYDELIECIKNKSADVIGGLLTVKDEYKDILTYSDTTHMSLNFLLVRYENLKESLTWHKPYESPDDLNGQVLGILKDSSMEQLTIDNFPKSKFIDKEDTFELFQALMMNEFDGFLMDEPNGEEYKLKYPNKITYFDKNYFDSEYSFAFQKNEEGKKLREEFNEFLKSVNFKELYDKWKVSQTSGLTIDKALDQNAKLINAAFLIDLKPMCFQENKEMKGAEIELLYKFAKEKKL